MDVQRINRRIKEIIADVGDLKASEIEDEAHFIEDLNLDSLALLELGVDVDYEFQLGVSDERLKELRSVAETVQLVLQYQGQGRREIA